MEEDPLWLGPGWLYPLLLLVVSALLCYVRLWGTQKGLSSAFPSLFITFQNRFLNVVYLFSAIDGLQTVYLEALHEHYKLKTDTALMLVIGYTSALVFGTFLGVSADYIGRRKVGIICGFLYLSSAICKQSSHLQIHRLAHAFQGLAASLTPYITESWMLTEHEKLAFRQDWVSDTFWLMSFGGAVTSIGSGALAGLLVERWHFSLTAPSMASSLFAGLVMIVMASTWTENVGILHAKRRKILYHALYSFQDKRIILIGCMQMCFDVALSTLWFLWTPTIVADGRRFHAGRVYTWFMASWMIGSLLSSLLLCGPYSTRPEKFLTSVFLVASICLAIPAYDYQEIGVLVGAFCVFYMCAGILAPSLSLLRSIYIPNDRRCGVMAIYRVPVSIILVLFLTEGAKYYFLDNNVIFCLCTTCLLSAALSTHFLSISPAPERATGEVVKQHATQ